MKKQTDWTQKELRVVWSGPPTVHPYFIGNRNFQPQERKGVLDDGRAIEVKFIPGGNGLGCSHILIDGQDFYSCAALYAPDSLAKVPQVATFKIVEVEA